jgi:ubiquinone/menaquinone biosynthesis C-methylase UbiE
MAAESDKVFAGSIPKIYETHLVPLIFEEFASDMVDRLKSRDLTKVLEIAAGTGVVTRKMAADLPRDISITATDLNQAMLDHAAEAGTARDVEWRQADAIQLPFSNETFDAVVCQFGVMFFPDRAAAYSEALRVLKPGGLFLFNAWDRIQENEFPYVIEQALAEFFPDDPPRFLSRTPYGYYDHRSIKQDLQNAGFRNPPHIERVTFQSKANDPLWPAVAFCQGTPLRAEIEQRDSQSLAPATNAAQEAIAGRFGRGEVTGKIQANVVIVEKMKTL